MPIIYHLYITRSQIQANRQQLFVFGDNLARWGHGGQAYHMRGEPNSVGLPTKASPKKFLRDADLPTVLEASKQDRIKLINHHLDHGEIVWPWYGIGTGLAALLEHAPAVAEFWDGFLLQLDPGSKHTTIKRGLEGP